MARNKPMGYNPPFLYSTWKKIRFPSSFALSVYRFTAFLPPAVWKPPLAILRATTKFAVARFFWYNTAQTWKHINTPDYIRCTWMKRWGGFPE